MDRRAQSALRRWLDPGRMTYSEEMLDQMIVVAGGLPDGEIEVGSLKNLTGGRTFLRQSRWDALREWLEAAANRHVLAVRIASRPSPAAMADDYAKLELDLYGALKSMLPVDRNVRARQYAALSAGLADVDVRLLIFALARLHRAARRARQRKGARPKIPLNERHVADWPLDDLTADLIAIWENVFDRRSGTSITSGMADPDGDGSRDGKVSGPLVAFFELALFPLLPQVPSRPAIRARIRKVLKSRLEKS